jgi:ribosomal protein S18 acetylase RimI-like enzyme
VIYALGVNQEFQGKKNPQSPGEKFSQSILSSAKSMAASKQNCIGISLWVRFKNKRAISFYEKVGFVSDPIGPVHRDNTDNPHLTMRWIIKVYH